MVVALLMAVGTEAHLDQFRRVVGSVSEENLMKASGNVAYRRVLLTHKRLLGKPVQELGLYPFQFTGCPCRCAWGGRVGCWCCTCRSMRTGSWGSFCS